MLAAGGGRSSTTRRSRVPWASAGCPPTRRPSTVSSGSPAPPHSPAPNPAGRVAGPEEVAAFVAHLLSGEARFVTGAALAIDGGSTAGT